MAIQLMLPAEDKIYLYILGLLFRPELQRVKLRINVISFRPGPLV